MDSIDNELKTPAFTKTQLEFLYNETSTDTLYVDVLADLNKAGRSESYILGFISGIQYVRNVIKAHEKIANESPEQEVIGNILDRR